ncbi:hypothetical protein [Burkholderia sp. GS2Y]|uniref:Uncharacterized protein n=1 Tax=Burkholderia theae TaxID=3143496 RepID=A0ABU9WG96_9BURK
MAGIPAAEYQGLPAPLMRKPEFVRVGGNWHLYIDCGLGTAISAAPTMGQAWRLAQRMRYSNPYLQRQVRVR